MCASRDPSGPPGHGAPRPPERPLLRLADADLGWLDLAIRLGRRGWGRVHPNPMVGCVLVRDGRVLSEGWHREFGGPHAEVDALERPFTHRLRPAEADRLLTDDPGVVLTDQYAPVDNLMAPVFRKQNER